MSVDIHSPQAGSEAIAFAPPWSVRGSDPRVRNEINARTNTYAAITC